MHPFYEDLLDRLDEHHRDLLAAIDGLPQEALDWVPGEDMNSLCVLVVHVAGAARYWIGDVVFGVDSGRDRDAEFAAKGYTADELRALIAQNEADFRAWLETLSIDALTVVKPAPGRTREFSVGWSLLHAVEHTALHTGHAQITRQLWDQR